MSQTTMFVSSSDVEYEEYVSKSGDVRGISDYLSDVEGPQGFVISLPEHNVITPHFHRVNQFQILFPADGALYRRTPIDDVLVHYADGYVTYGPISTSTAPMEYFTLRAIHDRFIAYMPEDRDKLVRRGKRNLSGAVTSALLASPGVQTIFEDHSDGLFAGVEHLEPGESSSTIDPAVGCGQFHYVLSGSAVYEGSAYDFKSLLWVGPDDAPATVAAGSDGLVLLTLRFPVGSQVIDGVAAS